MNQQGQWQVVGSAPEVYERELVPAVFGVWAPILVELAQPRAGERVVDVACGTGIVARIAAAQVGPTGAVVGVDLNPGMLSVARSCRQTRGPADQRHCHRTYEFHAKLDGTECRLGAHGGGALFASADKLIQ
jgi:methylase of polypeptide subunit release factors